MKKLALATAAIAALAAFGLTDAERIALRNLAQRPRCEARKCVVSGGVTNVVETWRRGGYEWTQTNPVRRVVGRLQTNTFEDRLAEARALAEAWRDQWQAATNRAAHAEARAARLDALKVWLEEKRDAAALPTTKALYQAVIDRMEGAE